MRIQRLLRFDEDLPNAVRRFIRQSTDQVYARLEKRFASPAPVAPFRAPTRFSLITVNFSTTYYLKLMLLTLCDQDDLTSLGQIIIVDNNSKDGGRVFLHRLAADTPHVHLVKNAFNSTHAYGLRKGIKSLASIEEVILKELRTNALLVCDTDIVFRNPQTLATLADILATNDTVFAGELRRNLYAYPEAQASFFAIRRDCYARPDVAPIVDHGAPAYFLQRSLWQAKLKIACFPSNHGGYILHRGRSGVAAAREFYRWNAYSTVENDNPHFMGVKSGEAIWSEIEKRHKKLLQPRNERSLLNHLTEGLSRMHILT